MVDSPANQPPSLKRGHSSQRKRLIPRTTWEVGDVKNKGKEGKEGKEQRGGIEVRKRGKGEKGRRGGRRLTLPKPYMNASSVYSNVLWAPLQNYFSPCPPLGRKSCDFLKGKLHKSLSASSSLVVQCCQVCVSMCVFACVSQCVQLCVQHVHTVCKLKINTEIDFQASFPLL